jgi:ribosome maturation factor RimP
MSDDTKLKVSGLVEKALIDEGFDLAGIALSKYKASVMVRVFVYGHKGVSLGDCARLSRLIGDIIDGTDLFESGYTLEVSSPGLDRPLESARDFKYRVGEQVKIEFVDKERKRVRAEIIAATDDQVEVKDDSGTYKIDLADISKAIIIF